MRYKCLVYLESFETDYEDENWDSGNNSTNDHGSYGKSEVSSVFCSEALQITIVIVHLVIYWFTIA